MARVARQGGGSGPDTPPANPDSTSGCTASIPALASGKALLHICWTSGSDSGPLFVLIKSRGVRGRGERGQECFCGSHTGSFCLKPSLGWMWADKWEKGRAGRCSRRPATTSALMLLCLASRCPPSLLPAMGHRCLDPPGFLPFVQMHPAGSLAWTNLHEKKGPAGEYTESSFVWSEAGSGWFARPLPRPGEGLEQRGQTLPWRQHAA